jgi:hypothetical protein
MPCRVALLSVLAVWSADAAADGPVMFNRDIRPILSDNCFACHGPDKNHRKADLRLDVRDDAVKAKAIVPGKPAASELFARVTSTDADSVMPPPDSHKKLTAAQKELLRRWIAEGAAYQGHWAYTPVARPAVPQVRNPKAEVRNPIDAFVQARLAAKGLDPAPEADRRTLLRRLSFDLTGLPPTPEEVDAFVADTGSDWYGKAVERLLASPHYGERMALGWLDVVRFADTIGYHSDNPRNVWPYRDWVIRAFNDNKPFDRFTVEQLAGDLLPGSTDEQKVGSAFNRLLLSTEEGGAQARDYEARMLTDRVRAVGTVWLGQTLGCCQCHDHKYDPSTMRDFYAMGAFFADIQEPVIGRREPGMVVADEKAKAELARLNAVAAELEKGLTAPSSEVAAGQAKWEESVRAEPAGSGAWKALTPAAAEAERGSKLKAGKDGVVTASGNARGGADVYKLTVKTDLSGVTALRLDALSDAKLPAKGPGRASDGQFVVTEFELAGPDGKPVKIASASATAERPDRPAAAAIDGKLDTGNGWSVGAVAGADQGIVFELAAPLPAGTASLTVTIRQLRGENRTLGRFRLSATSAAGPHKATAALPPKEILDILRTDPAKRSPAAKAKIAAHYAGFAPELADLRAKVAAAKKAAADYEAGLPRCLVSKSGNPRTVRILPRGNWMDQSGPVMVPALPAYLPGPKPPADGKRLTRLDLAEWIVSRENPLTARVTVNRLWKQFFGVGLSKTLDDFGSQGEWPADPALLDWLAAEFMDSGWDVRHMIRLMVSSSAYRQASTAPRERIAADPDNRDLARQSRFRLDAELVRDNALAVSGLLVRRVGGPSVKPYQPDGYWENLNFPARTYAADKGEDQYRRGLYVWWQRSFLHPSLLAFDAPSREECAADRSRSNIPQQALVLLNDPTYVEAARVLAGRAIREGGAVPAARVGWMFRRVLQRSPRPDEAKALADLIAEHAADYAADRKAAESLLKVGLAPVPEGVDAAELAAWTSGARVLLNLHETITRN